MLIAVVHGMMLNPVDEMSCIYVEARFPQNPNRRKQPGVSDNCQGIYVSEFFDGGDAVACTRPMVEAVGAVQKHLEGYREFAHEVL